MKLIQLGRNEYWIVTSAVSPLYMYSGGSADCGSIQPVPVAPITTSSLRENAPVRSSPCTRESARAAAVGALSRPT